MNIFLQLKFCSDQVQKLAEDRCHHSASLEIAEKKLSDVKTSSVQARESLVELQVKVEKSRFALMESLIELEKERYCNILFHVLFNKCRIMFIINSLPLL